MPKLITLELNKEYLLVLRYVWYQNNLFFPLVAKLKLYHSGLAAIFLELGYFKNILFRNMMDFD